MTADSQVIRVIDSDIPAHWRRAAISDLLKEGSLELVQDGNHGGNYPKATEFESTGIPLITGADLNAGVIDFRGCQFLNPASASRLRIGFAKPGDVLLSHKGTMGKTAIVPHLDWPYIILNPQLTLYRVRENGSINRRYLKFFFDSAPFRAFIERISGVSTISSLSLTVQKSLEIPLPPLPEQKAIARILGTLDDKIELNRRMNATLEAMARALFQSWFVDFDPVHAKAAGRQPSGTDATTASFFPSAFQASELGEIPEGWRLGSIYEVAEVIYGAPFSSKQFNEDGDGKPLIRIRDLADESPGIYTPEAHPKGYMVQPGNVVVGMDGEFRAYLWGGVPAWLNQRVCVFAPKPTYSAAFVRNSIIAPLAHVEATETATTVIHLGKNDIDRFKVIIPQPEVHAAFAKLCQPWYDRIVANKQQSRTLATLRDTLLPKLLSGDLAVSDSMRA
jgi:type I restriction enzyme S subunit